MYEQFYGLLRTPFAVTPDPAMLFMSRTHREALATIIYGVETRKGFIVCTGEVGTGKSTIIRAYFDQARGDEVKLIYIFTPQVTPFEMSRYICGELGLGDPESIFAAVPQLQLKLLEEFESGRTVVLMIDEAQLLPPDTLEFLRLLSNFETDTEKLIQIVLVGQPELDDVLARIDMRQVSQRVALRARLAAFAVEESYAYIGHRLRLSGAGDLAQVMSPSAGWLIAEAAGGIPRVINILADNALIAGFGAAQRPLGSQLAGSAIREFTANAGAAGPLQPPPLAPGWRVARRLRGALAREKGEPADWVSAAPAASVAVRPMPTGPPVGERSRPIRQASPEGATGTPVSSAGLIMVEPVAQLELPAAPGPDAAPGPSAAAPPAAEKREAPASPPARRDTTAAQPAADAGAPKAAATAPPAAAAPAAGPSQPAASPAPAISLARPAQWPALSRVLSGLQGASRRGPGGA